MNLHQCCTLTLHSIGNTFLTIDLLITTNWLQKSCWYNLIITNEKLMAIGISLQIEFGFENFSLWYMFHYNCWSWRGYFRDRSMLLFIWFLSSFLVVFEVQSLLMFFLLLSLFVASMVWSFLRCMCFLNSIAFEFHTIVSMVLQCSNQIFLKWPWTMNFLAMVEKKCMNFFQKWHVPNEKHLKTLSYRSFFGILPNIGF